MYENHFNLNERPFRNVPDTKMFFEGGGRGDILCALKFAIESGEGIIKVVGEVGSGKTMLCRMLDESLSGKVEVVFLSNPSLEPEYILHAVAQELGLPVTLTTNRFTVQQTLQRYLLKQHEKNKQVVVLIEEAQCMPPRTLEEIRLMSNLETEKQKLLQLVLFGQPELDQLLGRADLRQFNERISYALYLKPFTLDEHREYLNHRLYVAGYRGPDLFNEQVVKHIYKFAKGSVRRINLLADKTLLAAYAYNDTSINIKHARSAAEDSKYIERVNTGLPTMVAVPAGVLAIVLMIVFFQPQYFNETTTTLDNNENVFLDDNEPNTSIAQHTPVQAPVPDLKANKIEHNTEDLYLTKIDNISKNTTTVESHTSLSGIRVKETMEWLKTAERSQYTIQLMTAFVNQPSELYDLEDILKNDVDADELKDFLVFRGKANGMPVYVICYRIFSSLNPARSALMDLPPILKRYRPFVRNVRSIMQEIGDTNA